MWDECRKLEVDIREVESDRSEGVRVATALEVCENLSLGPHPTTGVCVQLK